ncbi:unnamed protein product [Ectocarpus sp. 8 AP-2014]
MPPRESGFTGVVKRLEDECVRPFVSWGEQEAPLPCCRFLVDVFRSWVSWCFCVSVSTDVECAKEGFGREKKTLKKEFIPPAMLFRGLAPPTTGVSDESLGLVKRGSGNVRAARPWLILGL